MKQSAFFSAFSVPRKSVPLVIFLFISFQVAPASTPLHKEPIGVFLNGKQINFFKDSLEITAKGKLSLSTLAPTYEGGEKLKFIVVIRHREFSATLPLLSFDERYNDGEEFNIIDIEKVLLKTKVGDQLLILPSDKDGKYDNTKEPFVINITGDRC
jgi:hypothetical protein